MVRLFSSAAEWTQQAVLFLSNNPDNDGDSFIISIASDGHTVLLGNGSLNGGDDRLRF